MFDCRANSQQSHKLLGRAEGNPRGFGLYAVERIEPGELLVRWGGLVMGRVGLARLPAALQSISLQIDEEQFLVPLRPCAADRVNHSCDPNAGMSGPLTLVAMRVIMPGEEVCYDYAMSDGSDYDEFECGCGAASCRGRVTGQDWRQPALWQRYAGYFSPYLERRIAALGAIDGTIDGVGYRTMSR
ncbi:MAG TPA: SET domain-containing protein-lysine N-methyltransferase [Enhygromyxa sp.]|nr:SET domain-containing protein-lysine N-methyltransferase [Enhygromyxa sp.]